ncbi:kielin/chordin-like protein [Galendromus occidentalis]|uniref:Kielin/chordin-like protein n=1 Tax=Galendromus occidentalis TaxID=34638 RepID=A0AAJ7SFZ5_9ACAR|nr:kielin/chordin-like protein [Galendromus occidentalis]
MYCSQGSSRTLRGKVVCQRALCEVPNNCFLLQEKLGKKSCCLSCRDCVLNGTTHTSSSTWTDPRDSCLRFSCQSGIITKFREECHTPCENPIPPRPGQCCPSCQGCSLDGHEYAEGTNFTAPTDPCLSCSCKNGTITCSREACNVLPCPSAKQVFSPKSCCPVCKGTKIVARSRGECIIGAEAFYDGSFPLDQCTTCSCANGTSLCHRTVCPKLQCPSEHQVSSPQSCCLRCRSAHQEKKAECLFLKTTYMNGTSWKKDRCTNCLCHEGQVECQETRCERLKCPAGQKEFNPPNECCPKCIESDGLCSVFGDPHYRTFDGVFYRFQGRCRYTLVTDECQKNSTARNSGRGFSVQVFNDPRGPSQHSARTRALLIKVDDKLKIRLGQMMKVKILSKRIKLPHVLFGDAVIYPENHNVVVKLPKKGITVVWNGDSSVDVSASLNLKGSLCGLCGNYNDNQGDEYTTKQGVIETDVNTFGNSWKVGHSQNCLQSANRTGCMTKQNRKRNYTVCNKLKGDLFKPCHKYVNPTPYIKSCLVDMCRCEENGRCFCDEFGAYVRHCKRYGVEINNWLAEESCGSHWCPTGALWTSCGGVCRKTCKNYKTAQCSKKCIPGCECQNGAVWLDNRCVHTHQCPRV